MYIWLLVVHLKTAIHSRVSPLQKWNESGFRPPLCTYRLNWARRTSWGWWDDWDDTVLRHRPRNPRPDGLRPSTLPLGHGGSPQYWLSYVDGVETFLFLSPPRPGTEPRTLAWKAAVLTTTLGPPPFALQWVMQTLGHCHYSHYQRTRCHRLFILCWHIKLAEWYNYTGRFCWWWRSHWNHDRCVWQVTAASLELIFQKKWQLRKTKKACSQSTLKPEDYGWVVENGKLIPVQSTYANPRSPPHMIHKIASLQKGLQQELLVWEKGNHC